MVQESSAGTAQDGYDWQRPVALARYAWRQFGEDRCLQSAGLLTYTTLLSLVPLLIVMLSTASALPGATAWNDEIQDFLFKYFLPEAQDVISEKLESLTTARGGLTATMGVFLIVTSLVLMSNIENALNRIWGVKTARTLPSQFVVYWSMLTLGPVLLGASLALSSYFSLDALLSDQQFGLLRNVARTLAPYAVASLAFLLLFLVVPNRRVPLLHAVKGALITAVLFELAKKAFGLYVQTFDSYTALYGALGSVPIFLLWIYLSWSVILLGASLTASLDSFRYQPDSPVWHERNEFVLLFRIVGHLWQAQRAGSGLSVRGVLDLEPMAHDHQIQGLLENLRRSQIVCRNDVGDWVLVRDLDELSIGELYATGAYVWPMAPGVARGEDDWSRNLDQALHGVAAPLRDVLDRPLKAMYARGGPEEGGRPMRVATPEKESNG